MLALCVFTAPLPLEVSAERCCTLVVRLRTKQAAAESGCRAFPLGFGELLESFAD